MPTLDLSTTCLSTLEVGCHLFHSAQRTKFSGHCPSVAATISMVFCLLPHTLTISWSIISCSSCCEQCPLSTVLFLTFGFVWQSYISVTIWLSNKEYLELLLLSISSSQQCNGNAMVNLTQNGRFHFVSHCLVKTSWNGGKEGSCLIGMFEQAAAKWGKTVRSGSGLPKWENRSHLLLKSWIGSGKLTEG